ncbi:MAG: CHAT domain-containing protein [Terriglobales bacterium]
MLDEAVGFFKAGDQAAALKAMDSAFTLAQETHDVVAELFGDRIKAEVLAALQRNDEAVLELRKVAEGWDRLGDGPGRIDALGRAGELLLRSKPEEAGALFQQAMFLSREEKRRPLASADALASIGERVRTEGNLEWAEKILEVVAEIRSRGTPDSLDEATSLNNLGARAYDQGDLKAAADYCRRALAIRQRLAPNSLGMAESLNNLGLVAFRQRDLQMAAESYRRALVIREKLVPDSLDMATTLNDLGVVTMEQGELKAAADYYRRALTMLEKLEPESLDVASSWSNLGNVAMNQGDPKEAAEYHHRALAIREKLAPGSLDTAMSLSNLGVVAMRQGDLEAAAAYHRRALVIREKLAPGSLDLAMSLVNLGATAYNLGDLKAAADYCRRALAIQEKLAPDSLDVAGSLMSLGAVTYAEGDLNAAAEFERRALAIREKVAPDSLEEAISLNFLGALADAQGDRMAAAEYNRRALAIGEKRAPDSMVVAGSLNVSALAAQQSGDMETAESLAKRAWRIVRSQADVVTNDEARQAFGSATQAFMGVLLSVQIARRESEAALVTLEEGRSQALAQLLFQRRQLLAQASGDLWPRHQEALARLQHAEEALAKAEAVPEQSSKAEQERENARKEYQQARDEAEQLWAAIQKNALRAFVPAVPVPEAARAVGATGTFVAFSFNGESDVLALTGPAKVLSKKLRLSPTGLPNSGSGGVDVRRVEDRILGFWRKTSLPPVAAGDASKAEENELAREGRELFDLLFPGEIGEAVRKSKRLVISPDGPLWELPFAALVTDIDSNGNPHYLGEQVAITYAPSLSLYVQLKQEAPHWKNGERLEALVVGDPKFDRAMAADAKDREADWAWAGLLPEGSHPRRLPATAGEAQEIAKLYGTTALLGENATEAEVRKRIEKADVIHLATHGMLQTALPMSSGVLLTPPAKQPAIGETDDDGVLQAWEIFGQLKLRAELVVLSACQTARGQIVRGEGVVGLTRALEYAGARSVVASQWSVAAGDSTVELMKAFHLNWQAGQTKDEALKNAMTAVRAKYPRPYYWAPFILLGDPDNPNAGKN